MGDVGDRLSSVGLHLPEPPDALGKYVPAVRSGDLVFTSGQLPIADESLMARGPVPEIVGIEIAQRCAELCALNALAAASSVCDLDHVCRVLKVVGYVASSVGFDQQPAVVNGASDVFITAFGDGGKHAREAVGVASLPMGAPVEVSVILELWSGKDQE